MTLLTEDSHWEVHMQTNSDVNNNQLTVLKDGSDVPNMSGFAGQTSAADFVADYIHNGKIVLNSNQTIYLFELGVNAPGSAAHDYQDLVVLVTMVPADVEACIAEVSGSPLLDLHLGGDAEIHYSAEAVAKLGKYLETVAEKVRVVVAAQKATAH